MKVKNLALTERPMKFDDVIGQDLIIKNLSAQSKSNKFFQSYLLYGHYGCGKTTTARILAAAINCRNKDAQGNPCGECPYCQAVKNGCTDMIEIDGASNTGIESIRRLKENVEYLPSTLDKKVYIIDEVHKLSDAAFNALLKVLEEPPEHVVFILATTDRDKIPTTVLSRLAKYEFKRISTRVLVSHLEQVASRNGYVYTHEGLATIARNSDGSVRNAIKMLEIVSELDGGVTEENAALMIGLADPQMVFEFLDLLMKGDHLRAFYKAADLMDAGWEPGRLTSEMVSVCSDAILAQERMDLVDASERYKSLLGELCGKYDAKRVITVLDFLMATLRTLRETAGDRHIFKNSILLFGADNNNRLDLLEHTVEVMQEKMRDASGHDVSTAKPVVTEKNVGKASTKAVVGQEPDDLDEVPWDEEPSNEETAASGAQETVLSAVTSKSETVHEETSHGGKEDKPNVTIDPFAMFATYSFASPTMKSVETNPKAGDAEHLQETVNLEETGTKSVDQGESPETSAGNIDEFLSKVENEEPVLDNLLALGFTPVKEDGKTVFETDEPAFFRMGTAFAGAMNGFPFEIRETKQ